MAAKTRPDLGVGKRRELSHGLPHTSSKENGKTILKEAPHHH